MRISRWALLFLLPAGVLMALFGVGLGQLAWQSLHLDEVFGFGQYEAFFARSDYVAMLFTTLKIAVITTIASLLVGFPAAYAIARAKRYRTLLMVLVILPWLVSVVVRTYGWIVILGNRGTLNSFVWWLGLSDTPIPFRLLYNETGVVIGLVHVFCPFMIVSILTVLMHVDRSLEEASMSLGAGSLETFARVVMPLAVPGIIAGSTLVFLLSTGAIVTPLLLGGRSGMLATQIYDEVFAFFNYPKAAAMAFILMLIAILLVWPLQFLERRLTRNLRSAETST